MTRLDRIDALGIAASIFFISLAVTTPIHTIELHGTSMNPVLEDGDRVICLHPFPSLTEGDIISYERPEENISVMHRIDEKLNSTSYKTKGDNNEIQDPYVVHREDINCKFLRKIEI